MKNFIVLLLLAVGFSAGAQQITPSSFLSKSDFPRYDAALYLKIEDSVAKTNSFRVLNNIQKDSATKAIYDSVTSKKTLNLPLFGINGIGNLNEETFQNLNGSGKISLYARPLQYKNKALTIYASFNVNASNTDSLLFSTLLFPEVGNNSFLGTIEWASYWSKYEGIGHSFAPFFEFSYKNIRTDSSTDGEKLYFSTLNYTAGCKYVFSFLKTSSDDPQKKVEATFFVSPYISAMNIPNEDIPDYQAILARGKGIDPASLSDNIFSTGIKIGYQVRNFGVFADFRSVLNDPAKIPIRELKGFHSNIGIIINADIFELKRQE